MDSQHAYRACDLFSWTWPVSVKCFFSLLGSSRVSLLDSSRVWSITKAWKAYKAQKEHLEETKNWLECTCYYLNDLKKSIPNPTQVKQVKWRQRKVDFAEKSRIFICSFCVSKILSMCAFVDLSEASLSLMWLALTVYFYFSRKKIKDEVFSFNFFFGKTISSCLRRIH